MTNNVPSTQVVTGANLVFDEGDVRIYMIDGEPWFVLRDLLKAMGTQTRTNQILPTITDTFGDGYTQVIPISDRLGRIQNVTMVNEAAMTFVVAQGKTETSQALNRKIHQEILPSIRKTGKFEIQPETPEEFFARALAQANIVLADREARIAQQAVQIAEKSQALRKTITSNIVKSEKIKEQKPKVDFYDRVTQRSSRSQTLTMAAKTLQIDHPNKMISILRDGIVFGQEDKNYKWLNRRGSASPLSTILSEGFMEIKMTQLNDREQSFPQPLVTGKGLDRLTQLFDLDNLPPELKCSNKSCQFCKKHFGQ